MGTPQLDDLPDSGQSDKPGDEDLFGKQLRMAANMLGINPDGGFSECDLNICYRRLALHLHPDVAARNRGMIEDATSMFQWLGKARIFIIACKTIAITSLLLMSKTEVLTNKRLVDRVN